MSAAKGKNGLGSIAQGSLDDEVLAYLQNCPTWEELHNKCRRNNFEANCCISKAESKLRMKREFVGFIDADNPPSKKEVNRKAVGSQSVMSRQSLTAPEWLVLH